MMKRVLKSGVRVFVAGFILVLGAGPAAAQSREQDRRIEEGKRDDLRATSSTLSATKPVGPPATVQVPAPIPQALEPIYFAGLVQKKIAYRYDAIMGILIVLGVEKKYLSLDSQVAFFQQEGFVPARYRESFDPMQPLRRGLAAYMFREALEIRGGIALHLLGPSERYAMKELGFQGLMSPGLVSDLISGQELVQTITQAANHLAKRLVKQ